MEVILRSKISHIDPRFCTGMVEFCHRLWVKRPAFEFAPWFIGWKEKVSAGVRSRGRAPGRQWLWCQCSCSEVEPMSIEAADFRDMAFPSFLVLIRLWSYKLISFVQVDLALILDSVNPQYDKRLFIEFPEKYKFRTCCVQKLFFVFVLTFKTIFVHNMLWTCIFHGIQ